MMKCGKEYSTYVHFVKITTSIDEYFNDRTIPSSFALMSAPFLSRKDMGSALPCEAAAAKWRGVLPKFDFALISAPERRQQARP